MKNSKFLRIAGMTFAIAIIASSMQPLLASAHEGSNSGKGNKEKTEKVKENKEKKEDKKGDRDHRFNGKCLPWGILHAWGVDKRLENGKGLPAGLFKKFAKCDQPNATTTPDTVAPKISDIKVVKATSTAAISWKTNESTTGSVKYSTNSNLTSGTTVSDGSLVLNHKMDLAGLTPDTKYYYRITVSDAKGNVKESSILDFRTNVLPSVPEQDTVAPNIVYAATANLKATSTRLVWITNEASDSKVWISTSSPVDISGAATVSSSASVYYHDITLDNLATSTQYFYTVSSTDSSGNRGTFTGNFFQTLAQ